ncbi:MAG: CPBP family intramembrane metalloprotease [Pirellulales bacterium]|nr:CPBP family intramembrane metalloprotease [Pirellulales bacterium]
MKPAIVKLILAREVRDQLRDRRTLFVIAVLPILLYPLLGISMYQLSQFMHVRPARVLVVGAERLEVSPPLIEEGRFSTLLFASSGSAKMLELHFPSTETAESERWDRARELVLAGEYEAALYFPADFSARLEAFRASLTSRVGPRPAGRASSPEVPQPELFYIETNEKSVLASQALDSVLQRWTDKIGEENLKAAGMSVRAPHPFAVKKIDVGGKTNRLGSRWAGILPVLMLLWAMTGAFYPAVDLCAGEKERGTLETLLSSPAGRGEIVLGKLLTIMIFSIATAVLNLLSVGATGWVVLSGLTGFGLPSPAALAVLAIALLPMAALFSALCLALAALARSTREGQYYLMPLLLLTLPLVILPMSPGVELNLGTSLIPVTGMSLVLRNTLLGDYLSVLQFAPVVAAVTLAVCMLAIRWAVEQFNRESVLFRESERFDLWIWLQRLFSDRRPTPNVAMTVFACMLILLLSFFLATLGGEPDNFAGLVRSVLTPQLAVFLLPTLLLTLLFTTSPRETLLLKLPAWFTVPAAALLAVVMHPLIVLLGALVEYVYPVSESLLPSLKNIQELINRSHFWPLVILIALAPAVCEELACRGFILSGFRHFKGKWRAIIYSALLFAVAHGFLQQSMLAFFNGLVIGYLAVQTGSILPCMVFHAMHNTLALANGRLTPQLFEQWPILNSFAVPGEQAGCLFTWPVVLGCAIIGALLLILFARHPCVCVRPPEEGLENRILCPADSF